MVTTATPPQPLPDAARARLAVLLPPLLRDCRSLVALSWEPELVARSQASVEELLELVSPLPQPALQSAVRELYAYLAGARMRAPDESYAREFGERTERLATMLAEFVPEPGENA